MDKTEKPPVDEPTFWEILDQRLLNPPVPRLKKAAGFYPSEASIETPDPGTGGVVVEGECLRKIWYRRKGFTPTETTHPDQLWKMKVGDEVHKMIVEAAKKAGIYVDDEVEFYDEEHNISGRVDLFYRHPTRGRVVGAEIKSIAEYQGRRGVVFSVYGEPMRPKRDHVLQVAPYLDFFSKKQGVHEWTIPYFSRDTGERSAFSVTLGVEDELLVDGQPSGIRPEGVHQRFRRLEQHLKHDTLPPRDYELKYSKARLLQMANQEDLTKKQIEDVRAGRKVDLGDWRCKLCPYKTLCWDLTKAGDEDVREPLPLRK